MHEQAIQHYFADKEPMLVEAVSRLVRLMRMIKLL